MTSPPTRTSGTADVGFGTTANGAPSGTAGSLAPDPGDPGTIVTSPYAANTAGDSRFHHQFRFWSADHLHQSRHLRRRPTASRNIAGTTYNLRGLTQNGVPPGAFSSVTTQTNGEHRGQLRQRPVAHDRAGAGGDVQRTGPVAASERRRHSPRARGPARRWPRQPAPTAPATLSPSRSRAPTSISPPSSPS